MIFCDWIWFQLFCASGFVICTGTLMVLGWFGCIDVFYKKKSRTNSDSDINSIFSSGSFFFLQGKHVIKDWRVKREEVGEMARSQPQDKSNIVSREDSERNERPKFLGRARYDHFKITPLLRGISETGWGDV